MHDSYFRNLKGKTIIVGGDHHARKTAELVYEYLKGKGLGTEIVRFDDRHSDYIEQSRLVAEKVSADPARYCGIVGCKNGFGVTTVCNKYDNVFAIRCETPDHALHARQVNYSNVLTFGSSVVTIDDLKGVIDTWLDTEFDLNEKNKDRLQRLLDIGLSRPRS